MEVLEGVLMYLYMFMFLIHDLVVSSTRWDELHGMGPNGSI